MRLTLQNLVMIIACTMIIAGQVQRMVQQDRVSLSETTAQSRLRAASLKDFVASDLQNHNDKLSKQDFKKTLQRPEANPDVDENAQIAANNGVNVASSLSFIPNTAPSYDGRIVKLLHAKSNGSYNAPVSINGVSMVMLVDTGASFVSLTQEDAKAIGIWPMVYDYNVPVSTANGQVMAARGMIPSIQIDNIRVNDIACLILPRDALQQSLLGLSFLNRLTGFNFENGNLVLRQ